MNKRIISIDFVFDVQQFATDIYAARMELAMSGEDVAKHLTIDKSALYRYEKALESNMKIENFLAVCNLYDIDPRKYFVLKS